MHSSTTSLTTSNWSKSRSAAPIKGVGVQLGLSLQHHGTGCYTGAVARRPCRSAVYSAASCRYVDWHDALVVGGGRVCLRVGGRLRIARTLGVANSNSDSDLGRIARTNRSTDFRRRADCEPTADAHPTACFARLRSERSSDRDSAAIGSRDRRGSGPRMRWAGLAARATAGGHGSQQGQEELLLALLWPIARPSGFRRNVAHGGEHRRRWRSSGQGCGSRH